MMFVRRGRGERARNVVQGLADVSVMRDVTATRCLQAPVSFLGRM